MSMHESDNGTSSSEASFRSSSSSSSASSCSGNDDVQDQLTHTAAFGGFSGGGMNGVPEVTRLQLQREQRLRRVLSQRHLGQPEAVPHNAFFCTRTALSEEDTVWLYTLTNSACFERLLHDARATTISALAGHLDTVLSHANPLFYFNYRMPVRAGNGIGDAAPTSLRVAPVMRSWQDTPPVMRKRPSPAHNEAEDSHLGGSGGSIAGASQKRLKTSVDGPSASSGLVAQSMKTWEAHLTEALTKEGETVDSFRQSRTKTSYTEKKRFQEKAAWEEYTREVRIQAQQRDREAKRALRRGVNDEAL
ncbi:hypothetical protein JKF63_06476 [Porcisia hertigi]|uniref:Uncharacterized protein n=1 Tax=Porcisia hertigi TaxID=2761500 RepID=A0A836YHB2_9TRYP|nr:hypothetical protein JKF63_06476 [Porcisia hertigi]